MALAFLRYDFDPEQFAGSSSIPMLVIGTKQDLAETVREKNSTVKKRASIADECGADEINVVSSEKKGKLSLDDLHVEPFCLLLLL